MLTRASSSLGSGILSNFSESSETLTLPSISLRMLRSSRERLLVLPVASIRPLPVLVRIDRRFMLRGESFARARARPSQWIVGCAYYRQVGFPKGPRAGPGRPDAAPSVSGGRASRGVSSAADALFADLRHQSDPRARSARAGRTEAHGAGRRGRR